MDILSYKLGKNASGGGGGGSTEWVYPLDKTPDQIVSELFGNTTLYAVKFLILNADDEIDDILRCYKNVSNNTETYFSDGTHLTGTNGVYNYVWDKTKDIETSHGKKRWIVQVAKSDTTLKGDQNGDYYFFNIEYCYIWSRASNYTEIQAYYETAYLARHLEIGNKNTTLMYYMCTTYCLLEDIKSYNLLTIRLQNHSIVKELDYTNAVGVVGAISDSNSYLNVNVKKIILGTGVTGFTRSYLRGLEEVEIPKDTDYDLNFASCRYLSGNTLLHLMKNIKDNSSTGVSRTISFGNQVRNDVINLRYVKEENGELVWCNSTDPGATLASTYINNKGWAVGG